MMTNEHPPEQSQLVSEQKNEFEYEDDLFDEPVDSVAEQATLDRLHRRNLKRIFIPMGLVILLSIVLGMIGPPEQIRQSTDQSDAASQSRDP
ncbi:MAG: hypothetical protein CMH52_11510 [Myxococcales bacterium]|nr:hypothetical protein [Myxococcales bacterium]|tara:strand:+ start:1595 stop:1870 length:276 start_codon:yes stop_codon:yes gene_type:complete